ncbi:MarR family winged helix-turn-helix transcriptional regulator [Synechococcus sp. PCC 6312]|uniref:MarR family winged helix-turn-helix transcriptional regulator n=1 Tax=Synechococcus sp. (strain ATCC 27167 / PCC 6312) TaxID=195253 RepID=UPI00029F0BAF|nr:MarR family winged helix-turn-helix transcriptional regulator [Synechococcus sp. PCC 6312]AFY62627.1 transcriptional regulator [Synechococcus sp. PCC 6312]
MDQQITPLDSTVLQQVVSGCACFQLRKATRVITKHFDDALRPTGLLITQFTVLAALGLAGVVSIHELADILVMDRTTLTRNLQPLERQGWITIAPGLDQRTRLVYLTPKGEQILSQAFPLWQQAQATIEASLGQSQWQLLQASLGAATTTIQS